MKSISIVVPVYNEQGNIALLHNEIKNSCEANGYLYEIIFIDDGSTDETSKIIKTLQPVILIKFRKNFGQTAAMDAGIKMSKHEYIVTMDGDRQNDPTDIPALLKHLEENDLDVVSGWRVKRKDNLKIRIMSRAANFLRYLLVHDGIHDSGCTLKIFKRECFENLSFYGEMHRFIPALLKIRGFKIGEIPVNHRPRIEGTTKYNWRRGFKGLIDMISLWFWNKYSVRPLHLLGGLGLVCMVLGGFFSVITIFDYFGGENLSNSVLPLLTAFLLLGGIQLFISGLLADTILKNYYESTDNNAYHIKEIINNE
jgi:glycosyltransferase involved in cell wall biosynthesis